eukprot:scaffold9441_cov101-Cylindrotheca_fusiformis.AAC.2
MEGWIRGKKKLRKTRREQAQRDSNGTTFTSIKKNTVQFVQLFPWMKGPQLATQNTKNAKDKQQQSTITTKDLSNDERTSKLSRTRLEVIAFSVPTSLATTLSRSFLLLGFWKPLLTKNKTTLKFIDLLFQFGNGAFLASNGAFLASNGACQASNGACQASNGAFQASNGACQASNSLLQFVYSYLPRNPFSFHPWPSSTGKLGSSTPRSLVLSHIFLSLWEKD